MLAKLVFALCAAMDAENVAWDDVVFYRSHLQPAGKWLSEFFRAQGYRQGIEAALWAAGEIIE